MRRNHSGKAAMGLLDNALTLVVENEMCGRLNGERMRARAAAAEHALDVGAARGKGSGHSAKNARPLNWGYRHTTRNN